MLDEVAVVHGNDVMLDEVAGVHGNDVICWMKWRVFMVTT